MTPDLPAAAGALVAHLTARPGGPSAAVVGIIENGAEPVTVSRGHAQLLDAAGHPAQPRELADDAVFDVASVTKLAVTTTLLMRLVDEGRLRPDDPVRRWFGDFAGGGRETVTVRDLLQHRGGLWEWWPTYVEAGEGEADALERVRRLPLRYPPGSGWHYSDLGFILLGEIVAREFADPLDRVADREIFGPLAMASTGFRPAGGGEPTERVVAGSRGDWYERRMIETGNPYPVPASSGSFTRWRTHTLVGEANDGNCWHTFGGVAGHAGLFTTASDLLRLGQALLSSLRGEGPWSARTLTEFLAPGPCPEQGLGFRLSGSFAGHPGFTGARFAVSPGRGRVLVLLTNRLHTTGEPFDVGPAWAGLVEAAEVS